MQPVTPQPEHQWLHKLVGEWTYETECIMGPDQPPMKHSGTEVVRSLGGLWTLGEGTNEHGTSLMTLGYDPVQQRFVGTFVASMMTHLWVYNGSLDADGRVLTMDCEGPTFTEAGGMAHYQDIFEFLDDGRRTLKSQTRQPDGSWKQFMSGVYTRTK
jgi:hypothetical protein